MSEQLERAPIATAPLSVILPVCHDVEAIESVLRCWVSYLSGLSRAFEILVVDDGSADETASRADNLAAEFAALKVLRHATTQGLGAALHTGIRAAQFPLLLCTDCDSVYDPADLKLLLDAIDQVDVAAGYRTGRTTDRRGLAQRAFARLVRSIFAARLRDVDCGFKLYRRSIFARIPIQSRGGFVHTEIIAKANFIGCLMTEVALQEREPTRPAPALTRFCLGERFRDASRVFHRPDFGPALIPAAATSTEPSAATPVLANPENPK